MDILNATFDIARVDPHHLLAFRGTPRRTLFQAGDRLYRLVSLGSATFEGNELFKSPWWYPQATYNSIVRIANRTSSSIIDTARARLAVRKQWNPTMEWLAIIELTKPAYGWVGPARQQGRSAADSSVLLMGNLDQVYMPGLSGNGNGQSSAYAFLFFYGSMISS